MTNDIKELAVHYGKAIYELNGAGGWCHIVLDDDNVEDDDVMWCLRESINDSSGIEIKCFELACMGLYLNLTPEERLECNRRIHGR